MKQAIRSSMGLASMFAVGFFILGTASEAQATSGGCFFPTFAVDMLLDDAPDDFVSNEKRCNEQCKKIRTACRRVALASAKCLTALFKGEKAFERVGCTDEEDVGACKADVRDDFSEAPAFVRNDLENAREDCQFAYEDCRADCSDDD